MAVDNCEKTPDRLPRKVWEKIEAAVKSVGYGSITIIVQDGKAIQIEINEKIRLA
jgi:Uncharacterized small protein